SFYTQSRSGEIVQRLTGDIQMVQTIVTKGVVTAITQSAVWLTSFVILFSLDFSLALITMLLLPFSIVPARKASRARRKLSVKIQEIKSDISSHLVETTGVSGALLTRLYGLERRNTQRYTEFNTQKIGLELKMYFIGRWVAMCNSLQPSINSIAIYVYGGYSVMHGDMTVGGIVAFAAYASRLLVPTQVLLNLQADIAASDAVFAKIFAYIDLLPETAEPAARRALPDGKATIRFADVSFAYDRNPVHGDSPNSVPQALHAISFEVRPGQMAAIVGPSGSGKSTLLALLARLYDSTSGTITINDQDICDICTSSLRARMAFVTQEPFFFHSSIKDNLLAARENASEAEMVEACKQAHIHDYIVSLPDGYETIVGERGYRLSGGERQRLSLARALLKKPDILILDEATSQLDAHTEHQVLTALEPLLKQCTTLVVAHRLSTVIQADPILVLQNGQQIETGTHQQLMDQRGLYASLYRRQLRL
ncbi:MAG: transporter related protein, partial [Paenibacillus sp.]|nr:transporter related protein [Paenibacillus sp.]